MRARRWQLRRRRERLRLRGEKGGDKVGVEER
jgi:hypothetical protein